MLGNEPTRSQRLLLMKLLQLTREIHGTLDELEVDVETHGAAEGDAGGGATSREQPSVDPAAAVQEQASEGEAFMENESREEEREEGDSKLVELSREHASIMEALVQAGMDDPELLDLALEAQARVRELMARLEVSRNRTLELLGHHTKQRDGAAAYASEAMRQIH